MAPVEHLPFRWTFLAIRDPRDGAIGWKWQAFTHTGELALESERTFEKLTDCMDHARAHGYVRRC